MKKLLVWMIGLFILYFSLKGILFLFRGNTVYTYELVENGNVMTITEKRKTKTKEMKEYYEFEIKDGKQSISFRLFHDDLAGHEKFIKQVEEISTSQYQCHLPIFKDKKVLIDMICQDKSTKVYYPYHKIRLNDTKLDAKVDKKYWSSLKKFMPATESLKESNGIQVARTLPKSLEKLAMTTYRGLNLIDTDGDVKSITLFSSDTYQQPLHAFLDEYYFVANYDESYDFQRMYLIHLKTGKVDTITSPVKVSFDAYIQGVVDGKIYILDRSNRIQYYFDSKDKLLHKCDNPADFIQYYNGKEFERRNIYDGLNQDLYFVKEEVVSTSNNQFLEYDKTSGYYYLFKKKGEKYEVYRSLTKSLEELTYLFETDSTTHIYKDNGIVYENQDEVWYMSNTEGTKKLVKNKELQFNDTVLFGALK